MTQRPEDASCFSGPDIGGSKHNPDAALDAGQPERPDLAPPPGAAPGSVDEQLRRSPLSPNELDGTDESQKAADITRAGRNRRA